ncbi:MAG: dihydrolipoamide dehydrogenase, partial [Gammaproteobacteria bacterium]
VNAEDPLITLESDKATMDVPSPAMGIIDEVLIKNGDLVSEGSVILTMTVTPVSAAPITQQPEEPTPQPLASPTVAEPVTERNTEQAEARNYEIDLLVLGSGPGGYTSAFRAADLGLKTLMVERYSSLGGVCLNVGCIPSKALLHAAKVINEADEMSSHGIAFSSPDIDVKKLADWKHSIVNKLTGGLKTLAKQRKVEVVEGIGTFIDNHTLLIDNAGQQRTVTFKQAVIATGSEASMIPDLPDDNRIMHATGALDLEDVPKRLLVVGGGIIGLEMATVYHALGSKVTVVEMLDSLVVGADKDIVRPLQNRIKKQYENIYLDTKVTNIEAGKKLTVSFDGKGAPKQDEFDRILVAVGRRPNGKKIGAESAGVNVDAQGFIAVDDQQRTNIENIFAIGDVVGQPMLAHKAVHEGKVAAEVAAGYKSGFDARVIPSVAYTDPEIAWVGVTEQEAKQQGLNYGKGVFPWAASGRSLSLGRSEGITKLLFDEDSKRVIGAGIVGSNAGDLIAEVALAIETGCDATDIGLTIHPHPTLSETVAFAAEAFEGTLTDLYLPKKKK